MRCCFNQTDLRQNALFHNFSRQITPIQYSEARVGFYQNRSKLFFKITNTASRFPLLTSAKFSVNIKRVVLQHNEELTVFIFFLFYGLIIIILKSV